MDDLGVSHQLGAGLVTAVDDQVDTLEVLGQELGGVRVVFAGVRQDDDVVDGLLGDVKSGLGVLHQNVGGERNTLDILRLGQTDDSDLEAVEVVDLVRSLHQVAVRIQRVGGQRGGLLGADDTGLKLQHLRGVGVETSGIQSLGDFQSVLLGHADVAGVQHQVVVRDLLADTGERGELGQRGTALFAGERTIEIVGVHDEQVEFLVSLGVADNRVHAIGIITLRSGRCGGDRSRSGLGSLDGFLGGFLRRLLGDRSGSRSGLGGFGGFLRRLLSHRSGCGFYLRRGSGLCSGLHGGSRRNRLGGLLGGSLASNQCNDQRNCQHSHLDRS